MQPKVTAKATTKNRKSQTTKTAKQQRKEFVFPLAKQNFMIIGLGILVLIVGYFLMSSNSVDGFMPTVVSPIFLVLGYCVIIPYGILKKTSIDTVVEPEMISPATTNTVTSNVSSNIKTS